MAHSSTDISPSTISFGEHILQTRNIASATIVENEERKNYLENVARIMHQA
jgi:ethanolamine utilization protein EutA (predicted chaperonin)